MGLLQNSHDTNPDHQARSSSNGSARHRDQYPPVSKFDLRTETNSSLKCESEMKVLEASAMRVMNNRTEDQIEAKILVKSLRTESQEKKAMRLKQQNLTFSGSIDEQQ